QLTLSDAASGAHLALEQFEFRGVVRSLSGPIKGDGAFHIGNAHYPFQISTGRPSDDGAVKVKMTIDPIERDRLAFDADMTLTMPHGTPHVDGLLKVRRPVGAVTDGNVTKVREPWIITSKLKGDPTGVVLEQVEFKYGPDDRAATLK